MKKLLQFSLTITAIIALVISCAKEEPELTKYVLTITASDGGKVSTPGGTYVEGETARITATADSGYIFLRWSNGSTDNPLVVTVNSNVSIQAIFEKETYSASIGGAVAKGAYVAGSDITFYELNDALEQTGKSYSTNTIDDIGTFSLNVQEITEDYARVQGDGYYWNEVTGETSPDRLRLNAISNVKENINVNILTHLEYDRVIELVKNQGKSFADAKAQAVDEVLSSLGIEISQNYGNAESYNFRDGNEASKVLLAASAVVVADKSSSEISSLITKIANDIKDNGNIDTESINTEIADKLHTIDISAIAANVYERYKEANENLTAESFESPYIEIIESEFQNFIPDADGDGVHDDIDLCPDTPEGEEADENGCSYTQKQYELDTNTIGLGSISEEVVTTTSRSTHDYGTTVRLTANPIKGWQFVAWSGDVESTDNPIEVSVDKDLSVTATFEPIPYEITISVEGEGEVTQKTITVADAENENTIIELTATPSDEWVFSEWKGAIESSDNPLNITMDEDKEITAVFVKKQYELTVDIEGEGTVTEELVTETGKSYESGSTVKLTATGNEGWQFKSWSGDIESTENPVEININSVKTVKAIFEKKDTDGDGVVDLDDVCPETPEGESVNASGCSDYIYLDDNGVTIKAKEYANIGDSKEINGVTYTVVDEATLRQMVADDEDVTKVVTSKIKNMSYLIHQKELFNQDISAWDTSNVETFLGMFNQATTFNQDLSKWNTSSATNMEQMFFKATVFNSDISNWNTSSVTNMRYMFVQTHNFNQEIGNWDTSNLINMSGMFGGTKKFNADISNWDTSKVTDMSSLFGDAIAFNQDIGKWNTSNVVTMEDMFHNSIYNHSLNDWDVSKVTNMKTLFWGAQYNHPLDKWDTSNVTTMYGMFDKAANFNQNINDWDVSNVINMWAMFAYSKMNYPLDKWNVSNVVNMDGMFGYNYSFNQDISMWCVSQFDSEPEGFNNPSALIDEENLPVWGTCPLEVDSDGDGVVDYNDQCSETPEGATVDENGCQIAPIYLDDNGVTIKARDFANVGDTWELDGITYTIVDEATLRQMVADDEDVTKVVTTKITNMSSLFNEKTLFNQDISSWDTSKVIDMSGMFNEASIFNSDISKWDTSSVSNMEVMFRRAKAFNINIGDWNTSKVTNLRLMFADADAFNQPIGTWDVSKVSNMSSMFSDADSFNNDLSNWNVSNVVNMGEMFADADSFNKPINTWNVSNVKYMNSMFFKSDNFNQSLNNWNVSNVLNMSQMFSEASLFDGEISSWDVSNVSNMAAMFSLAKEFNQDISNWDVSKVENMNAMFYYAVNFNNNISSWCVKNIISEPERFNSDGGILNPNFKPVWGQCGEIYLDDNGVTIKARDNAVIGESYKLTNDGEEYLVVDEATLRQMITNNYDVTKVVTSKITSMNSMFAKKETFNQNINNWDVSNVTNMNQMFWYASTFNQDLNNWDVSNVTNMHSMFDKSGFNGNISSWNTKNVIDMFALFAYTPFNGDLSNWDTSSATNMHSMFESNQIFNQDISNWDVSKVENFRDMFTRAINFNQDISQWDVSSAKDMIRMFSNTGFNYPLNNWNVSNVTNFDGMFMDAVSFNQPLEDWNVSSAESMQAMFARARSFNQSIENWNTSSVTDMANMFDTATAFNQNLSNWCVSNITIEPESFSNNSGLTQNKIPRWGECPIKVGDYIQGGFVFYIYQEGDENYDATKTKGLVVSIENIRDRATNMGCYCIDVPGTLSEVGAGINNTRIWNSLECSMDVFTAINNYSYDGYTNWSLPSIDELELIYTNLHLSSKVIIPETYEYWSSTQGPYGGCGETGGAWMFNFSNGEKRSFYKSGIQGNGSVRAIKEFETTRIYVHDSGGSGDAGGN